MANVQEQPKNKKLKCVYIDSDIHRKIKTRSAQKGQTMQEYCELVLMEKLDAKAHQAA